jgi:hypothetical protein
VNGLVMLSTMADTEVLDQVLLGFPSPLGSEAAVHSDVHRKLVP